MQVKLVKGVKARREAAAQPLLAHLIELRGRLLFCLFFFLAAFIVCYYFAEHIYAFLVDPLAKAMQGHDTFGQRRLIYTNLTEAFFTYLGVSLWAAFLVIVPLLLTQIWLFIMPGLYKNEKVVALPYLMLSPLFFTAGAAAAYYWVFPVAWKFFLGFETTGGEVGLPIQLEARVGEYLGLAMSLILAFGLAFELPLFLVLLMHLGVLSSAQLREFRRFAIVGCFIIAAIITPPDVVSQLALAIPMCLFYEIAVLIGAGLEKSRRKISNG